MPINIRLRTRSYRGAIEYRNGSSQTLSEVDFLVRLKGTGYSRIDDWPEANPSLIVLGHLET